MSTDLCFTGDSSFCLLSSFFFIRRLISELAERNSTISDRMTGSKCNMKMHVRNPFPLQIGGLKTTFLTISQLKGNIDGLYLRNENGVHKRASALQPTRSILHSVKTTWTLVYKRLQTRGEFSPTLREFCIPLHCQASQTEISKRNLTTLCQTVDGNSR